MSVEIPIPVLSAALAPLDERFEDDTEWCLIGAVGYPACAATRGAPWVGRTPADGEVGKVGGGGSDDVDVRLLLEFEFL